MTTVAEHRQNIVKQYDLLSENPESWCYYDRATGEYIITSWKNRMIVKAPPGRYFYLGEVGDFQKWYKDSL